MDFTLTSEQAQFRDSIARLVDAQTLSPTGATTDSYAAAWTAFAELGMTGLCVPEERGGISGAGEDIALIAIELGRAPSSTPRIEVAAAIGVLLSASDAPSADLLRERFVAGELQPALAIAEGSDTDPLEGIATVAHRVGDGYELTGRKVTVIGGATADQLLVVARLGDRLGVFAVGPDAPGVARKPYRLTDTTPMADIVFTNTRVDAGSLLIDGPAARATIELALDTAIVAQCATAVGSIDHAIALTIDYLKTRRQFGKPLAEFQVLQHQVADLFILASDARSILYAAIAALSVPSVERRRLVSACKVKVSASAKEVTGRAVHLHGGIGFTTEYAVGHHFRRAMVDEKLLGDVSHHLDRHIAATTASTRGDGLQPIVDLAETRLSV